MSEHGLLKGCVEWFLNLPITFYRLRSPATLLSVSSLDDVTKKLNLSLQQISHFTRTVQFYTVKTSKTLDFSGNLVKNWSWQTVCTTSKDCPQRLSILRLSDNQYNWQRLSSKFKHQSSSTRKKLCKIDKKYLTKFPQDSTSCWKNVRQMWDLQENVLQFRGSKLLV